MNQRREVLNCRCRKFRANYQKRLKDLHKDGIVATYEVGVGRAMRYGTAYV
jgi:hypothetical protein